MENGVPPHFHKENRIEEKDLIPNGAVLSALPATAEEGTRVVINNPNYSVYQTYQYLGGAWRLVNAQPPVLSSLPASADEGTIVVINANNLYTYFQYLAGAWRPLSTTPTISATAGEDLLKDDAVFVCDSSSDAVLASNSGTGEALLIFGKTTGYVRIQQAATLCVGSTVLLSKLILKMKKVGSPTDNVVVTVRDGSDGNILATATLAASSLTTSYANYTLTLDNELIVPKNAGYYVQLARDGSLDNTNYYQMEGGGNGLSGFAKVFDGTTWNGGMSDFNMSFLMTTVAGRLYKNRTDISGFFEVFTGFSTANVSKGATATIDVGPIHTFANALSGYIQYLTDSPGLISSAPGTHAKEVGVALSSTVLQVSPMFLRNYSSGTGSVSSSTTTTIAHGLGVRPRLVRITALGGNTTPVISQGVYDGHSVSTVYYQLSGASGAATDSSKIIYIQLSTGNSLTATIAVDATNITLTSTLTGTATATFFMWEAFS